MYKYIACNTSESEEHFVKFETRDEVEDYIEECGCNAEREYDADEFEADDYEYDPSAEEEIEIKVYRIKDLIEAIKLRPFDEGQKREYLDLLQDDHHEFDADLDLLEICDEVGEFDV